MISESEQHYPHSIRHPIASDDLDMKAIPLKLI